MSAMQSEMFEAFRAIGIPEDKALEAAAAPSKRDDVVPSLKTGMAVLEWMWAPCRPWWPRSSS